MRTLRYFACAILIYAGLLFSSCVKCKSVLLSAVEVSQTTPVPGPDLSIPKGWALTLKPKEDSLKAQCGNYSRKQWNVKTEGGQIKISPDDWKLAREAELGKLPAKIREIIVNSRDVRNVGNGTAGYHIEPFEKGWLVGTDAGEWGGKLSWVSEDGSKIKELVDDNIRGIAKIEGEVFILSGLAHLSMDEGKLWKLSKDTNGNTKAMLLKELGSQPQGFVVKDKNLLVALNNKLLLISLSGESRVLNETSFHHFYPNSMAITSSGVVYVGARHFVVRFVPDKDGYREEWLVPKNCRKFFVKDMDCVCRN